MFATIFIEREPPTLGELPRVFLTYLQNTGSVAAIGLLIWCIAWFVQGRNKQQTVGRHWVMAGCIVIAALAYLVLLFLYLISLFTSARFQNWLPAGQPGSPMTLGDILLTVGGAAALLAVLLPILKALTTRLRWGRIWALASVSIKEALRKKVTLVFAAMALIFLFADWFIRYKAEDQIRNYVSVLYLSISVLFLLTAGLLGAFSIPTDVKNQTIHTVVTKPVEKFEIVLGRFLGYGLLLSAGLAVISGLSLIYLIRGVNPDAAYESQKARVPIYGALHFYPKGDSVGREWEYRKYVSGPQPNQTGNARQYAIWEFNDLPASLVERSEPVKFEFTFDVFRLNRGQEGKGIFCTFAFADGRLTLGEVEGAVKKMQEERAQKEAKLTKKAMTPEERKQAFDNINLEMLSKYRVVEVPGVEVTDYHTQSVDVPTAFFKRLFELEKELPREGQPGISGPSMMHVLVNVDSTSPQQMLGAARRDFYLLADERPFEINFLKGIVGIWCTFMLVLGVAVACSTYFSGVISLLCTVFLFGAGLSADYIKAQAENKTPGGGPLESAYRLMKHSPLAAGIDANPTTNLLLTTDEGYRKVLRFILKLIPDINRYDLQQYVANGFDIPWGQVLFIDNLLPVFAYLLPWGVLAFYLISYREIANPM